MSMFKELSYDATIETVTGVQFCLLSPEEIKRRSVVQITTHDIYSGSEPVTNGVLDTRMGVIDSSKRCPTCGQKNTFCPGHFGHIELAKPVFFVQFLDVIKKLLRCVCFRCSALVMDPVVLNNVKKALLKFNREKRFDTVYKMCTKTAKRECLCCKARQPTSISRELIVKLVMEWKRDVKDVAGGEDADAVVKSAPVPGATLSTNNASYQMVLWPEDIEKIFRRISDDDCEILGFGPVLNRPEWMICTMFPVPPPCVRPTVHNDIGQRREDDLTHKICEIIKMNNLLTTKINNNASRKDIESYAMVLQFHVGTYADNQLPGIPPSQHRNGRPIKSVTERLKSKEGRIRGNLMGKRVDFSARSVITPDPNISIDELGVPIRIAMNLTFPEVVNVRNIAKLQEMVNNGPDVYPGAKYVRKYEEGRTVRLMKDTPKDSVTLQHGDVVDRHLVNGDPVLFNRQPSLHKMSMMAHRVHVMNYDTFRLNPCVTPCYNADYDGDEMNAHIPQSIQTAIELELAAVPHQILSPRLSTPIITIVQDIALGVYRLSGVLNKVREKVAFNMLSHVSNFNGKISSSTRHYTGLEVLSHVIPRGVYLNIHNDDDKISINNGTIDSGVLTKGVFSSGENNLIQNIFCELGPNKARMLLDDTQRLICDWLCTSGFSVGVSDLLVPEAIREQMSDAVSSKKTDFQTMMTSIHNGSFRNETIFSDKECFEHEVKQMMQTAGDAVYKLINFDPKDNRLVNMLKAGSKGKKENLQQMVGILGQQGVEEDKKRIPYGFDGRTLPHFHKYDDSPEARGFVEHSFMQGLSPYEFFFHAMGGREGLIDTAVKTSDTGYIQRKLVKAMEDERVHFDLTVRNVNSGIVQFAYGGDGFDAARLEKQPYFVLKMSLAEIEEQFFIADRDFPALKAALIPSAYDAAVAVDPEVYAKFYDRVLEDRKVFIKYVCKGKQSEKFVYFPVHFPRIVMYAQRKFVGDAIPPSDLDVKHVIDTIEDMCENLRINKNHDKNVMLGILMRAYLNPKDLVLKHGINNAGFKYIVQKIRKAFISNIAHPSELVGIVAAQSVGEPSTQMTLNTFHSSGIATAGKSVQGVPRLKELLHASKNIKTQQMRIFVDKRISNNLQKCQEVVNEIEMTYLRDIVKESAIFYDPEDSTTDIDTDKTFVVAWQEFNKTVGCSDSGVFSPWLLRFEFDHDKMLEKGLTMYDIYFALTGSLNETISCVYSDDNTEKLVLRIRLAESKTRDILYDMKLIEQQVLNDLILKGITGIKKVVKNKEKFDSCAYEGDTMAFTSWEEITLGTDGSNLVEVLAHPLVNKTLTISNDVHEIYNVLGVEAARGAIINEIRQTLADLKVQERHLELLVDTMCVKGGIMSIDRHGINRGDIGPLAKCSFEESAEKLIMAGTFADIDRVNGVSANIMLGQIPNAGTGDSKILIDIRKLVNPYELHEGLKGQKRECRDGLEMLNFDFQPTGSYIPGDI